MKRLTTLALAVILISGCNAMKPNPEETELLSKEIEKRIYAQALPANAPEPVEAAEESKETATSPAPIIVREQEDEAPPTYSDPAATTKPVEELQPENPVLTEKLTEIEPEPAPQPHKSTQVSAEHHEQAAPQQAKHPEKNRAMIDWPYPAITCPPEPEWPQITCPPEPPASTPEWPYITAPEPPTYTPEPEPNEPPQVQPTPTPQPTPAAPCAPKGYADPVNPTPEPTPQPATPTPEPPAEQPSGGYAECSCGARLTPEEVLPHMKAHALNGESHSYRAY